MKKLLILLTAASVLALAAFSSCEEEITAEEKFMKQLAHAWQGSVITVDGMTLTGAFENFRITFKEDKTFTTQNGNAPIWPSSGSFTLEETSTGFNLVRSDDMLIEVEQLTDVVLVLRLQYTAAEGRTQSVSGNYEFQLTRL